MSNRPFSSSELQSLREIIKQNGWKIENHIENYFRCSIKDNKLLIFTIKFPVTLPIRLNIPFEVVNFQVSLVFQLWNLNQNTYKIIVYFLKMLRSLALQTSIEHNFPVEGKENTLLKLLNILIPDLIKDESDSTWQNRIRISLMNKREQFKEFDLNNIKSIVEKIRLAGLEPMFKQPWELKKGIPKLRTSEILLFSNDEQFDEFFILEKGYFTYFKDLEYNKFYIRTFFGTYTPYILSELFKNESDFKIEILIENWIKFARLFLNSIIEIINAAEIYQNELVSFNPERELTSDNKDFELEQNNFPFSALNYESSIAKQLFPIHNDLLNSPPTNFEVIDSINYYTDAEELVNNYRFEDAAILLNDSLKIFNKNKQKKVVVSVLMKLRKIAHTLGQHNIALNYLQSAFGITKSGEVPIEYIIKIHYKLGKSYYNLNKPDDALNHFNIIINFLENEEILFEKKEEYLGLTYLYLGLIYMNMNQTSNSKNNLKKAFQIGNSFPKVKLKYHLYLARAFKKKENFSQAQKHLKLGIDTVGLEFKEIDPIYHKTAIDLTLELAEFYIHYRKDSKKANNLLNILKDHLNLKEISGIRKSMRWNLLMSDFYNIFVRNKEKYKYYLYQNRTLKGKLQSFGILD